jgi:antitoxin component HigA of HigAB toxin-antitoxin module
MAGRRVMAEGEPTRAHVRTRVDRYESQHEPIEPPDPIDVRYHMKSRGLTRRDLEPFLGGRARVAGIPTSPAISEIAKPS